MATIKISALAAAASAAVTDLLEADQAGSTKSLTVAQIIAAAFFNAPILASTLKFTAWNPSDVVGTQTVSSAATATNNADYVTASYAGSTGTLTFNKAGTYKVTFSYQITHTAANTASFGRCNAGGTATIRTGPPNSSIDIAITPTTNFDSYATLTWLVTATAGQTFTMQPQVSVIGTAPASGHTANASLIAQYVGG